MRGHGAHSHKNTGNRPMEFHLRMPKRVLFFSLPIQNGLSGNYPASILTAFETKDVNRCAHAYTGKIFRSSAHRILQVLKQLKMGTCDGYVCDKATAQTAQRRAMGIVWGPSRHPKDVPFVSGFWWGTYGLGAIIPRKQPISAKLQISTLQNYKFQPILHPQIHCNSSSVICMLYYSSKQYRFEVYSVGHCLVTVTEEMLLREYAIKR